MNAKPILITIAMLTLLVTVSNSPATEVGTVFTYQGQIKYEGSLFSGTADFNFSLYDAQSDGNQLGSTVNVTNVSVQGGYFAVELDFGSAGAHDLKGQACWLEIEVCTPTGCGTYTTLSPRQPVTATPYALALPGFWTEQNAICPNIIGGYSGNYVAPGVVGGCICGGGVAWDDSIGLAPNIIYGEYGFVGGGIGNSAGTPPAKSGMGMLSPDGKKATSCGGEANRAEGDYSSIGGGKSNTASAHSSRIGGGYENWITTDGDCAAIAGGQENFIDGSHSTIAGGWDNEIGDARYSCILGGIHNLVGSWESSILGGRSNTIRSGANMMLAFGKDVAVDQSYTMCLFEGYEDGHLAINCDSDDGNYVHPLYVGTDDSNGDGAFLSQGGAWTNAASSSAKESMGSIEDTDLMNRIRGIEVEMWTCAGTGEQHIGPYAEDFCDAFDVGVVRDDGTRERQYLAAMDVAGVSLAAVKALDRIVEEKEARIKELEMRLDDLEARGGYIAAGRLSSKSAGLWTTALLAMGIMFGLVLVGQRRGRRQR